MSTEIFSQEQIAHLTTEQRLELIEALWDSLDQSDVPITPAQVAELDRRMEDFDQDAALAEPWDVVRKRIEQNLS
jgi:putative addiction module component (TIGR02574 family)